MKKKIATHIARVREHSMLKDGWFLLLIGLNLLGLGVLLFWSITHIHPTELSVPIRYTSFANFDILGKWFQLYEVLGIATLSFSINLILAFVAHSSNRVLGAFLLMISMVTTSIGIAIIFGFTAINFGGA